VRGVTEVRAKSWDALGIVSGVCRIDEGPWQPMRRVGSSASWGCTWDSRESADGVHHLSVRVKTVDGREASDTISVLTSQSARHGMPQYRPGDDANAIGAYPEKGILGTQLGPNKNGRKW
jgi:Icc protein